MSVRTIKRDLAALERSGEAVWSRPGPGGGYGMITGTTLPPITLSPAQAVALLTAVSAATDAPYVDSESAGVRKILDVLDPVTKARAVMLAERVWVNHAPPAPRTVRSALEEAMTSQRVVRIEYLAKDGSKTNRDVEPVLFASANDQWHLVGWCRLRDAMRWFTVSRIERASVTTLPCSGHGVDEVGEPPTTARAVHGSGR